MSSKSLAPSRGGEEAIDRCYTISEFASAFGMDRSTARYRLSNLAKAGVISVRKVGPLYIYCPPSGGNVLTSEMARRVVKTAAKNLRSILATARGWPSISTSDLLGSGAPSVWRGFIKELISWILASEEGDCMERGREIICPRRVWEEILQRLEEGKIVV